MLICATLRTAISAGTKPRFRVPKKTPTCRGVASGEAGYKLAYVPVPGLPAISVADQRQKYAIPFGFYIRLSR